MRRLFWGIGGLVIATGLAISSVGTVQAAPIGPAAVASQNAGSLATPVHCRVYRHCHRRCCGAMAVVTAAASAIVADVHSDRSLRNAKGLLAPAT